MTTKKQGEFRKELKVSQWLKGTMFAVGKIGARTKQNGGQFVSLRLGDKTGYITGSFFVKDNAELNQVMSTIKVGDVVAVTGQVGEYLGNLTITINSGGVSIVPKTEYDIGDFKSKTSKDVAQMTSKLKEDISNMKNPSLKALCEHFIGNEEFLNAFQESVGAESRHHNCAGGLLAHTYEVVQICKKVAELHSGELNEDLLITGALLHDIGKLESYEYVEAAITITEKDKLVGHLPAGALAIKEGISELRKKGLEFPKELENQLLHLVLSHHGEIDLGYGSPVNPELPEAVVLFHADNLDSQTEGALAKVRQST